MSDDASLNAAQRIRKRIEEAQEKRINEILNSYLLDLIEQNANPKSMASVIKWNGRFTADVWSLKCGTHKEKLQQWAKENGFCKIQTYSGCDCGYCDDCRCSDDNGVIFYF